MLNELHLTNLCTNEQKTSEEIRHTPTYIPSNNNPFVRPAQAVTCGTAAIIIRVVCVCVCMYIYTMNSYVFRPAIWLFSRI